MQQKLEEAQEVIGKLLTMMDEHNQKLSKVKDLSNQQDFTWSQKYQDDMAKKDRELQSQKNEFEYALKA